MFHTIAKPTDRGAPPAGGHCQPDLFTGTPVARPEPPPSLAERFAAFHEANPEIYRLAVRHTREWIRATGRRKLGIASVWERLRWDLDVKTSETSPKLNNVYKSFYARLIMQQEPDLRGVFDIRKSVADDTFDIDSEAA